MDNYDKYSRFIIKSVDHIFKNFLNDSTIDEVYTIQSSKNDPKISVEISGSLSGEIIIIIPVNTLNRITKFFIPNIQSKKMKDHHQDIAGELANLITSTFANILQYAEHNVRLSAPEFNNDPIELKAFYENINISFSSDYGGFDIDLYYKEDI